MGSKGCVVFATEPVREYRDYLTKIHHDLTDLAWLYHMNNGIFMTPGQDEEWTLSVLHTDADLARYVEVFETFARDVTSAGSRRRHVAHRVLGQRGDRQARVHADVGRDRRAVADEQVLVAEHALAGVDHAALTGRRRSPRRRGCARCVGMLATASMIELCAIAAGALGEPLGERVGDRDEGRVRALGVLLGLQPHAAARVRLRAQRDRVVERLHHEHDDRAPRPAARVEQLRASVSGCRAAAPSSFSGRVTRVPSPTSSV